LGVALPRTAQQQWNAITPIQPAQARPGDLVVFARTYPSDEFITHIGIVSRVDPIGTLWMIDAPDAGGVVREEAVAGFWVVHFAGVGRVGVPPPQHQA
jgi:cell wall-associated NlpC family hydrolase